MNPGFGPLKGIRQLDLCFLFYIRVSPSLIPCVSCTDRKLRLPLMVVFGFGFASLVVESRDACLPFGVKGSPERKSPARDGFFF